MVQLEYFPVLIDAHRNDLRAIAQPRPRELAVPSWRRVLGLRMVRLGRWLEGTRPAIAGDVPGALTQAPGNA